MARFAEAASRRVGFFGVMQTDAPADISGYGTGVLLGPRREKEIIPLAHLEGRPY